MKVTQNTRISLVRLAVVVVATCAATAGPVAVALCQGDPQRGADIFALAGGCGCHTPDGGPVGAGGRELPTPFGTFYGTNITPDAETGIGAWTDDEIATAIRDGWIRGKGAESPVMPYYLYAGMADRDVLDLIAYLRTLEPVRRANREPEPSLPFARLGYRVWRLMYVRAANRVHQAPPPGVESGRYLANHVAICGDCHTPRNALGAPRDDLRFAGVRHGPDGRRVPNITPDGSTGLGSWDIVDLTQVLRTGMKPNFDNVQGLMAEVVDGRGGGPGYSSAPEADLRSIAVYLKTLVPIEHDVR